MNLILGGGGSSKQSEGVDKLFTSLLKNNKILYIPIAMDRVKHSHEDCLSWIKGNLSPYGNFNITLWDEEDIKNKLYEELLSYGGIFIGGGNTYKLLKYFKDTHFDKKLMKLLSETDIPVSGGSAGAVIFAKNIGTVEGMDPNIVGLEDLSGLNMVNGKDIWVHYKEDMDKRIEKYVEKTGVEVIAIPEESGLYITKGMISEIGKVKRFR